MPGLFFICQHRRLITIGKIVTVRGNIPAASAVNVQSNSRKSVDRFSVRNCANKEIEHFTVHGEMPWSRMFFTTEPIE
ncbi:MULTISPECIES: hypothetical protein [unclassified Mesorhizobium]|uniref:hypothetical protein n=1 Tax=unclassified Mesorhizobium TaxID=325217 RepID=UPI002415BC23|nr:MULTISPECIES: hypothetical protein [unclassified Mesorhizobium]WFP62102.1 hypothetical protein QAZ47_27145 [Mesorhizobium sp. WSM4904]WFP75374.1 hypothetical protein QAZ22_27240 [Mesorhizobium sp. WSM4906]